MQKMEIVLLAIFGLLAITTARPQDFLSQFLTFKNGNIGVNFGGYSASAGLGGLTSGGHALGGLHASARTPFGANAQAGLGGHVNGNSGVVGGLQASAGLGAGNPNAAAAIGGQVDSRGSEGGYLAGATSGVSGAAVSKSVATQTYGVVNPGSAEGTFETRIAQPIPSVHFDKTVNTEIAHSVPSVASKTVQTQVWHSVPTITKTVHTETLVPVQPDFVKVENIQKVKTSVTPKKQKTRVSTVLRTRVNPSVQSGVIVEKAVYPALNWNLQKYIHTQTNPVEQIQYFNSVPASASASADIGGTAGFQAGAFGGGYAGGYGSGYGGGYGSGYGSGYGNNYYVKHQPSPQLFDDIFNIPISTLTAVNQLLRNKGK